jgi:hypothetical protein
LNQGLDLRWREREHALRPAGLVAPRALARTLLAGLAQRDADALQGLSAVATASMLVLLGEEAKLPWLDGVRYCAPAPGASGLWLPTGRALEPPADLVHEALRRRTGQSQLLLWPEPEPAIVLGLDGALPLQPAVLAWLAGELA